MADIHHVVGDATAPAARPAIIVHICNDIGGWGAGFVLAVSRRWPQPEAAYRKWHADRATNDFRLGAVQLVEVEPDLFVANLVGQRGLKRTGGLPPVRYDAINEGLSAVSAHALQRKASVHMPRIGCGLAGGRWEEIEPLIQKQLVSQGVDVTVYDLKVG